MNVLATYLLAGAAGANKGMPYKLWVLSSSPSSVTIGPNDSIIATFNYSASPFTSQRNAVVARLNSSTDTIEWCNRYAVNHSFNQNQSTYFGNINYNSSTNKLWVGATSTTLVTLNPSNGNVINSPSPNFYSYNQSLSPFTSDGTIFYATDSQGTTFSNYKLTPGSSTNTATVNWYSTWSNIGSNMSQSGYTTRNFGTVMASNNKLFTLLDVYRSVNDNTEQNATAVIATNSDGSSGNFWTFSSGYASNNINEPFGGIFTDYSGNIYISKGFAARNGSYPNRRLVSYNSSMGHRYTYYPSLPGKVSSGNPNLSVSVLGSDSSNNLYLGITQSSAGGSNYSFLRIAKVNQSGTILWQYSSNVTINSVIVHPTNSNIIVLVFSNGRIMVQKPSGLITGTWGSITIAQTSDLSLVSDSEYWPANLNSGNSNINMSHSSQSTPSASIITVNTSGESLSVSSSTTIA